MKKEEILTYLTAIMAMGIIFCGSISYCNKPFVEKVIDTIKETISIEELCRKDTDKDVYIKNSVAAVENCINESIGNRIKIIEFNTTVQSFMGKRSILVGDETVIKLDNGYLTYKSSRIDESIIRKEAEIVSDLNNYVQSRGIQFHYYMAPYKADVKQLPLNYQDTMNEATDLFLQQIAEKGVCYTDFRKELKDREVDFYSNFYRTDHHWKIETGKWAASYICNKLEEEIGLEYNQTILDDNNFSYAKMEKWFLGSQGKKVGPYWGEADDFTLITPNFTTNFMVEQPYEDRVLKGDFKETLINFDTIKRKDFYNINTYGCYAWGDRPEQVITNQMIENDKKILVIRDSFACAVTPFLALTTKQLNIIDLRNIDSEFSIYEYIDRTNPDAVIILYNPSSLRGNKGQFRFE